MARMLPIAAPVMWQAAIRGGPRRFEVIGATTAALYLGPAPAVVPGPADDPAGGVLALLTRDAVRLPFGAVLAIGSDSRPWVGGSARCPRDGGLRSRTVVVGGGRIRLATAAGDLDLVIGRWLHPARPRAPRSRAALAEGVQTVTRLVGDPPEAVGLPAAVPDDEQPDPVALARRMGLGPGLTPYADDVLAGRLLASRAWGVDIGAEALLRGVAGRTTAVSAACLHSAAAGHGVPDVVALVDAVGGHGDIASSVSATLRLGHTSGHGLAMGVLTAGRHALGSAAQAARKDGA